MTAPMRAVKAQYFLGYAPLGSLGPLLPIFLKHGKGFVESQIGILIALTAISMVVTPVLLAFLADTRVDSRRLLAGAYLIAAASLTAIFFAEGVVAVSLLYLVYALAIMPTMPLIDALFFSVERAAESEGRTVAPYQFVRVWGTIGYIVPSVILYFLLRGHSGATLIMPVAAIWCLLAAANTFALPRTRLANAAGVRGKAGLPTFDALRTLLGPGTRVFCFAMFLGFMSAITYVNFFPHYLRDIADVREESIGLVMNIGVVLEVFFMWGFGPLRRRLRLKGVLVLGFSAMLLRVSLLAVFPSVTTAIAVQSLHGMEALALYVVPVIYIDRLAGDGFRSSIQGAYMMTVLACSRMLGALASGWIGEGSVISAFYFASAASSVALIVLILLFKPVPVRD